MLKYLIFSLFISVCNYSVNTYANGILGKEIKYTLSPQNGKTFNSFEKGIVNFISKSAYSEKLIFTKVESNDSAEVFINYGVESESFLNLSIATKSTQYNISSKIEVTTNGNTFVAEIILKKIKKDFLNYFEKSIVDAIEYRFATFHVPTNQIEGIWATDDGYKSFIINSKSNLNNKSESFNWISLMPNSLFETIGTIKNSADGVYQFSYRVINQFDASLNTFIPSMNKIIILNKPIIEVEKYSYESSDKATWIKVSNSGGNSINQNIAKTVNPIGTAFSIGENFIATNFHVIDELKNIYIKKSTQDERMLECKLVISDKKNDITILKVIDSTFIKSDSLPYNLATRSIQLGEEVYAFGYPLNKLLGNGLKVTNGTINSKNGFQDDFANFQFSANIYPGNSGGPLISKEAEVIGITVAKLRGTEMINYAIKLDYLFYLSKSIEGYKYSNFFDSNKALSSLPKSAELISNYVFNIYGN